MPAAGPIAFSTFWMYSERASASSAFANISTTAPPSVPVLPAVALLSVIHAREVYWPFRPRSWFSSSASVTVVTLVMDLTLAFSAVATEVASVALVGVGVGLGAATAGAVLVGARADEVVALG